MPKSTKHPKTQQMNRVNQKAHYAMNRSAILEKAYMNVSAIVIQHVKAVTEGRDAQEAITDLAVSWQQNDHMLREAFLKLEGK